MKSLRQMSSEQYKVLFENEYVELREKQGYTYIHEKKPEGVALFVYREVEDGTEVLGRFEPNPAHGIEQELCSITGKIDPGESPKAAAIRELKEETGYICTSLNLQELGTVFPYKGSDYILHLFAIDVESLSWKPPQGDGSIHEENSFCRWIRFREALTSADAIVSALIGRWFLRK